MTTPTSRRARAVAECKGCKGEGHTAEYINQPLHVDHAGPNMYLCLPCGDARSPLPELKSSDERKARRRDVDELLAMVKELDKERVLAMSSLHGALCGAEIDPAGVPSVAALSARSKELAPRLAALIARQEAGLIDAITRNADASSDEHAPEVGQGYTPLMDARHPAKVVRQRYYACGSSQRPSWVYAFPLNRTVCVSDGYHMDAALPEAEMKKGGGPIPFAEARRILGSHWPESWPLEGDEAPANKSKNVQDLQDDATIAAEQDAQVRACCGATHAAIDHTERLMADAGITGDEQLPPVVRELVRLVLDERAKSDAWVDAADNNESDRREMHLAWSAMANFVEANAEALRGYVGGA